MGVLFIRKSHHLPYYGIDLYQTRDYVKVACDRNICHLLKTHNLSTSTLSKEESEDAAKMLYKLRGQTEETADAGILCGKMSFSYRQLPMSLCMPMWWLCLT